MALFVMGEMCTIHSFHLVQKNTGLFTHQQRTKM